MIAVELNGSMRFRLCPGVYDMHRIDDETVLYPQDEAVTDSILTLDPMATVMFDLLRSGEPLSAVLASIVASYDVSYQDARRDLGILVRTLVGQSALEVEG